MLYRVCGTLRKAALALCSDIFGRVNAVCPYEVFDELHGDDGREVEDVEGGYAFECGECDTEASDDEGDNGSVCAPAHLEIM